MIRARQHSLQIIDPPSKRVVDSSHVFLFSACPFNNENEKMKDEKVEKEKERYHMRRPPYPIITKPTPPQLIDVFVLFYW